MPPNSSYSVNWVCSPHDLLYNSALPPNHTLYICCPKSDAFVELFVCCGAAAQRRSWPPDSWSFHITHNGTPNSVGLFWTSDWHVAETSTWPQRTLTTDNHVSSGVRSHNLSRRAAARLYVRLRGHWDRNLLNLRDWIISKGRNTQRHMALWRRLPTRGQKGDICISYLKHLIASTLGYSRSNMAQ